MESLSTIFFAGFYVFSVFSICWVLYLAYAHDGGRAYLFLSEQRSASFLNRSILSLVRAHFEMAAILVCFVLFLYALCRGFSEFFVWIPADLHLTLGDGSRIPLSTVVSCFVGVCSALVFGKWVFRGIFSYWEKQALADQAMRYFDIIRQADNVEELSRLKEETLETLSRLERTGRFIPEIIRTRLEFCVKTIDLRLSDIRAGS